MEKKEKTVLRDSEYVRRYMFAVSSLEL